MWAIKAARRFEKRVYSHTKKKKKKKTGPKLGSIPNGPVRAYLNKKIPLAAKYITPNSSSAVARYEARTGAYIAAGHGTIPD